MPSIASKLVIAVATTAFICGSPVDLVYVGGTDWNDTSTPHLTPTLATAQAREARQANTRDTGGRQTSRDASGTGSAIDGRDTKTSGNATTGRAGKLQTSKGQPSAGPGGDSTTTNAQSGSARVDNANGLRGTSAPANNPRVRNFPVNAGQLNRPAANNGGVNNVNNVGINNAQATRVNAAVVQPTYVAPATGGAAVAAGATTVTTLPPSCSVVVTDSVTYYHCGAAYYVSTGGSYVTVNPPR
ncbi:MAG: hypothetical protein IT537_18815 [Hyphomicrobiales bacterium]|nr:hypothetical protein [Hyphomicrobiales bacterium]